VAIWLALSRAGSAQGHAVGIQMYVDDLRVELA
jgi:hypothetical protein